jgi:hypothetical protein
MENFIPAAVDSTCRWASGVADLDTSTNTGQVVSDFADGGSQISFTDAPQDPSEVAGLKAGTYEFIPIAVSATVVAYLGGDDTGGNPYPIASYDLTPNMVSGIMTGSYLAPYGSDVIMPPLNCKVIVGCSGGQSGNYTTFNYLDPAPTGSQGPATYGTFFSSTESGASYQVTSWMCSAPNVPFTVTVPEKDGKQTVETPVQVLDAHTAAQTLTTPTIGIVWPPVNDPTAPWPYTTCDPYNTLPALSASNVQYQFSETQDLQANALRGFAYEGGQPWTSSSNQTRIGFGAMDWSEASYYGFNAANIQNSSGDFVGPSASSIDTALNDATSLPDGVLSFNYTSEEATAYPMPQVTYALVSTASQSPADSQAEGDLLTNLVCYSANGGSIALPAGYVPLTQSLYNQATSEIQKTFPYTESTCNGAPPKLPAKSSTTTTTTPPGNVTTSTSTSTSSPGGTLPGNSTGTGPNGVTTSDVRPPTLSQGDGHPGKGTPVTKSGGNSNPPTQAPLAPTPIPGKQIDPVIFALAEGAERWVVAGIGLAAVVGIVAGPLIFFAPRARKRLAKGHSKS